MFSRGSRFPSSKAPEVPGPGAYNPEDPDYDAYKRGAFLEKTNRFNKDKPSEAPDPGAYDPGMQNVQNRPPTRTASTTTTDRLAVLQRKLEELERIHIEDKKSHHLEQERLKVELSCAQKAAAEQTERADKFRKQNETLDARVQELKKTSAAEQAELRDLRVKLRASEHERTQLAAKQGDVAEVKKAEARRKDELRERDRKIAELEKTLNVEKKKRETAETKVQEAKARTDEQVKGARVAAQDLENQLRDAQMEAQATRGALQKLEARAEGAEEELVARLEQHRYVLTRVAQEYGKLASTTIALSAHQRVKQEALALQLRNNRLERKLANSDSQVVELANLIRQLKEEKSFLAGQLNETQVEAELYRRTLHDVLSSAVIPPTGFKDLEDIIINALREQRVFERDIAQTVQDDIEVWGALDRGYKDALLFHSSVLDKELDDLRIQLDDHTKELAHAKATCTQLSDTLRRVQAEYVDAQRIVAESGASLAESNIQAQLLKKQLEAVQAESQAAITRAEQGVQQEKKVNKRLATSLHQTKQAEQFLRSEVEQLSSDLTEAEKFQEAYNGLLAEVDALVVKNMLAEEEAQRLSKFNAEILGHNNPAQRIMYVDRIRRELHETKQKLLVSTRDGEMVLADNDDLRAELEMYKSVAIPQDVKPRTTITRVARLPAPAPEVEAGNSWQLEQTQKPSRLRSVSGSRLMSVPEQAVVDVSEEMTLDEIM